MSAASLRCVGNRFGIRMKQSNFMKRGCRKQNAV
jgi:hypothetical protein